MGDDAKYLRKLPRKKEDCCECNNRANHGKGRGKRLGTVCAKCMNDLTNPSAF
jgi:hypothetical protein